MLAYEDLLTQIGVHPPSVPSQAASAAATPAHWPGPAVTAGDHGW